MAPGTREAIVEELLDHSVVVDRDEEEVIFSRLPGMRRHHPEKKE